jgi:hypothetical protein
MVGNLGADLPLWMAGDALLAKPLSMLAKTAPVAKGLGFLPKAITPALGTGVRAAATFGGPINALETAGNNDGLEGFGNRLKEAPLMGLGGVALHGAGQAIGKGVKTGIDFNRFNKATKLPEINANPLQDAQNSFRNPVDLRTAKAQQLNKTFENAPNLMEGVRLKPLQQDIDEAVGIREPLTNAMLRQRKADVKSALTLRPGEEAPLLQRKIPKEPKPLTWTNREVGNAGPLPIRSITQDNLGQLPGQRLPIESRLSPMTEVTPVKFKMSSQLKQLYRDHRFETGQGNFAKAQKIERAIKEQTRIEGSREGNLGQLHGRQLPQAPLETLRPMKATPPTITPTVNSLAETLTKKDIGNFKAYTSDIYRISRDVFGKDAGNNFTKPLDVAKGANVDMQIELVGRLKTDIVEGLGIKKASKESALVQRYGEGKITLDELKAQSPDNWQKISKANDWFRKEYDSLIERVNESKRLIYPNAEKNIAKVDAKIAEAKLDKSLSATERNELLKELDVKREDAMRGKIIPKRADYFRHFTEMAEGVKGLQNIFDSPSGINTQLIGTSEFARPRSKWASFAQKRIGNKTEEDAVGGFLNYIPSASYATHIDPQIARLREYTQVLRDTTAETHNVDTFIGFLDKYTNDLAGKTNPLDRVVQDMIPGGRKTFAVLTWMNNRVKANVVLGKASSMLAQFANIPNGIAFSKQYAAPGLINSLKAIRKPSEAMKSSPFLKERFIGKVYREFNESLLDKPKDFAVYLMETADKIGTNFIWNSAYAKAIGTKAADPIRFADMATRDLVAGRGVGEVPILQKSKLFQLVAPFQLEVANLWRVQKDFVNAKDFGGLISLFLLNYGFNEIMINTRGNKVTFDPIRAGIEAVTEKNIEPSQRVGRVAGEVFSNIPLGQTMASLYPEYGMAGLPSRKALFGSTDPTRFGSGVLLAKGIQDPLAKLALPFGGEQVKKTYQGLRDLKNKGHFTAPSVPEMLRGNLNPKGKLSYPVNRTIPNAIKGTLFGPSAFTEARSYYDNNGRPLSKLQTEKVMKDSSQFNRTTVDRKISTLEAKIKAIKDDENLTDEAKTKKVNDLKSQIQETKKEY